MDPILKRHPQSPLFSPNPMHLWESKYVFNPAVVYDGELFHMLYRAQGADMVSRMGYAVSPDGIKWNRMEKPVFEPQETNEMYGVEDPRLTFIDGKYYMTYTAYSPENISVALASTNNFINWERYGIVLPESPNKDAAVFPEKINGKYVMFHRIEPDMWLAFSDDMVHWGDYVKIASPREDMWDNVKIGVGGTPVKTDAGWLVLYHGVGEGPRLVYRLGFMLLDYKDPTKIIKRSGIPALEPTETWEKFGGVPSVVFSDAIVEYGDEYFVYYGGADNYIALATVSKKEINEWIKNK